MGTFSRRASSLALVAALAGCSITLDPESVKPPPGGPAIALSASSLTFSALAAGADPAAQTVMVTNSGTGTLAVPTVSVSYTGGGAWCTATVWGAGAPYTVRVQPTVGALMPGTYRATISVSSVGASNTPRTIAVSFMVTSATQPAIGLSTTALSFSVLAGGANPPAQTFTVSNTGGGTLGTPTVSPAYGSGSGWLQTNVTGASAPFTVSVQPLTGALAAGTYTATLSVAAPVAGNSPQQVSVTFTVGSTTQPTIALSTSTLGFTAPTGGANPAAHAVTITNVGAGVLAVPTVTPAYGSGSGWLQTTVTGASAPYTLTVQALTGALAAGIYTATLSVGSAGASNSPQPIAVTFTVGTVSLPAISLSTATLDFSGTSGDTDPVAQTFTVNNSGGGALATPTVSPTYGSGSGWLETTVSGASAPFTVSVQPRTSVLQAGTYTATLSVASPGATNTPQSVSVTFTVGSATQPTLSLSPTSMTFAAFAGDPAGPAPQTVTLSNVGAGTLAAPTTSAPTYGTASGWLTIGAPTGPAGGPYAISLSAAPGALGPGTYGATFTVSSAGASNSPQTYSVTFDLAAPRVGCVGSGTRRICAGNGTSATAPGGFSAGAAAALSGPTRGVGKPALTSGGRATIQSPTRTVRASTLVPGTATP